MTQIEQIRAEIERRKNIHENAAKYAEESGQEECCAINTCEANLCENLLAFIESLEKEQPMICPRNKSKSFSDNPDKLKELLEKEQDVDLEKEFNGYFNGWKEEEEYGGAVKPDCYSATLEDCKSIARHFYDLGCRHTAVMYDDIEFERQRRQEQKSQGLDEAAEKFNNEDAAEMWDYQGKTEGEIVEAAFKAGAIYERKEWFYLAYRLCQAILFDWPNKVQFAKDTMVALKKMENE